MYQSNKTISYCALCDYKIYPDNIREKHSYVEDLGHVCESCFHTLLKKDLNISKKLDDAIALSFKRHKNLEISIDELTIHIKNILYQIEANYFEHKKSRLLIESRKVNPTETEDTVATFWKAS